MALALAAGCDNPTILSPLPGTQWQLSDTTLSAMSFNQIEVTAFSNGSRSLYAGPIGGDMTKESVILLRPALFDSLRLADSNFVSADLIVFRRVFRDSTPDPSALFELSIIVADSSIWSETDTGLTADLPRFGQLAGAVEVSMTTASILVPLGDSTETLVGAEYLKFPIVAETLRNWLVGSTVPNGFMLRQIGGSSAAAFDSRLSGRPPIIALTYIDTADGSDLQTVFANTLSNLAIAPPAQQSMPTDSTLMVFNYYNGWAAQLDFSPSLVPDSTRRILTARLHFRSPQLPGDLTAATVTLRIDRRLPGDSPITEEIANYSSEEGQWTVNIGDLADAFNTGRKENLGINIRIVPVNHNFDTLIFYSPYAEPGLRPTLELLYAAPYEGSP
ncbi:MAG: hypothetical protein IID15_06790 [Candidatus Marinimicrobia bacterium]|nr:hypothetical protein [Candidatus Neomarinimicrobiota bacterium]